MQKKQKRQVYFLKWLIFLCCLFGSGYLAQSLLLDTNAPIKAAKKTDIQPGQVKLNKTAKPVPGMVNQWDITLRIEGRNQFPPPPSDIVLVIDTSGSMNQNNRMPKAKSAAEKFINTILREGYNNRIALVTYSNEVTNFNFNDSGWSGKFVDSKHKGLLIDAIRGLKAGGGTFTQAAIKSAADTIKNATGKNRSIVLISDGVPTFSYVPASPYNQFEYMERYPHSADEYTYYETTKNIPEFDYTKPYGRGADGQYRYSASSPPYGPAPSGSKIRMAANHANSAIAEATIRKKEIRETDKTPLITTFYTIGVDLDLEANSEDDSVTVGNQTLKEIASSEDKCFSATSDNLEDILKGIAGELVGAIKTASVTDPMGTGFTINGAVNTTQGSSKINEVGRKTTINWNVGALKTPVSTDPDEDVMYAEITYRVDAGNPVLNTGIIDANGLAATNGRTLIIYKDYEDQVKITDFPIPRVRPIIVSLQKKLLDENGSESSNKTETFDFKYGDDPYTSKDSFSLSPNEVVKTVHPWKADQNYFVEELLKESQKYETEININGQKQSATKGIFKFVSPVESYANQQIIVTNRQIAEQKKVFLNIRQSVVQPNEDLVIPSKGYYKSTIGETKQRVNIVSGSTTKNTSNEVGQELFTKYEIILKKGQNQVEINDLIPEYYGIFGYIATTTDTDLNLIHLSSNTADLVKTNKVSLNYQNNNEYWLTMFITPNLGTDHNGTQERAPRPYSWSYKENKFGK
ncbi:hypothetical protein DOK67_0001596 [Enterococcus sp. DIV0212c]|nr:vWA domain-containing protein [Enterococcus sp. DIV0212c]MBO1354198.1 VWA domain-containing protein [Enterococcus sp. DIV0212c]